MKNKRKAILLVGALLCLNLNIFSQNIPLKMNKVSVKKAMTELKEKSGYSFVYIAGDLDTKKIVDIDAEQLQEVIEQILEGQNVSYEIKDKNIIIRKKEVEQSMLNEKKLQDISGLVMDVMGEPEGGNLAASKIRNLECPSYEICLIDYGCGKFNRKIHIMEQYP